MKKTTNISIIIFFICNNWILKSTLYAYPNEKGQDNFLIPQAELFSKAESALETLTIPMRCLSTDIIHMVRWKYTRTLVARALGFHRFVSLAQDKLDAGHRIALFLTREALLYRSEELRVQSELENHRLMLQITDARRALLALSPASVEQAETLIIQALRIRRQEARSLEVRETPVLITQARQALTDLLVGNQRVLHQFPRARPDLTIAVTPDYTVFIKPLKDQTRVSRIFRALRALEGKIVSDKTVQPYEILVNNALVDGDLAPWIMAPALTRQALDNSVLGRQTLGDPTFAIQADPSLIIKAFEKLFMVITPCQQTQEALFPQAEQDRSNVIRAQMHEALTNLLTKYGFYYKDTNRI